MEHAVALEILENELELINSILKYYEIEKSKLKAQGFSINDASYRHWATNKAKLMIKRVQLQRTVTLLKEIQAEVEEEEYYDD